MSDPIVVAVLSVIGTIVVILLLLLVFAGFNVSRLGLGLRLLWRALGEGDFAQRAEALLASAPPEPPKPPKPSAEPIRFLLLLQREGRLVDFLTEDIQGFDDAQVGAAVREVHTKCQAALKDHLDMEPVIGKDEGATVEIPSGFDPSAVRLVGNVTGNPPFRGRLLHRGWRVKQIKLAPAPEGQDLFVLQPAEVELP
jgi:Domain of unknown function (DUF2760)